MRQGMWPLARLPRHTLRLAETGANKKAPLGRSGPYRAKYHLAVVALDAMRAAPSSFPTQCRCSCTSFAEPEWRSVSQVRRISSVYQEKSNPRGDRADHHHGEQSHERVCIVAVNPRIGPPLSHRLNPGSLGRPASARQQTGADRNGQCSGL
jgi:hypothetical protein